MPNVGGKKFPYTAEGMSGAEAQAENTWQEVVMEEQIMREQGEAPGAVETGEIPSYDAGGRVERIQGYGLGGLIGSALKGALGGAGLLGLMGASGKKKK